MSAGRLLVLLGALLLLATPSPGATRKQCRASACRAEVGACRAGCTEGSKRQQRRCRKKCKADVTKACRSDVQPCGGGGGGGGECGAYTATAACAPRSLAPLRARNFVCIGASGAAQPCDYDHDTKFRVRTPWRTHEGECCVIDTCRGATAFGVYDNLANPALGIPPGSSLLLAPVTVTVQSLSSYFQQPPAQTSRGRWDHLTTTIFSIGCSTPPAARVTSVAGGPLVAVSREDFNSYDTRPIPPPTGSWDFLSLSGDETSVSLAPPRPPLLPECGSAPDTLACQPTIFDLDSVNFIGERNPVVAILSERISLDRLCDDAIFASAEGTFRRQDGSECSVSIHARAKIGCTSNEDCLPPEVCTTTDPTAPADFGNAFPGWSGQSCVIPAP
jgi:hypothetical protein